MRTLFVAGNWKMYKTSKESKEFVEEFKKRLPIKGAKIAVCAPFTSLKTIAEAFEGTEVMIGAQNMHFEDEGAYTGEVSGKMLKDIGVDYCIIGHSERRKLFGETDEVINKKLHAAYRNEILPILCVGEVLKERDEGKAFDVVTSQLKGALSGINDEQMLKLTIAYEPVWAIGTGRTATPEQADEMCAHVRSVISELFNKNIADQIIIQYGGSVKPDNASDLLKMKDIDGALVGGASLDPASFAGIVDFK
jgi:triosephosphate isomerase